MSAPALTRSLGRGTSGSRVQTPATSSAWTPRTSPWGPGLLGSSGCHGDWSAPRTRDSWCWLGTLRFRCADTVADSLRRSGGYRSWCLGSARACGAAGTEGTPEALTKTPVPKTLTPHPVAIGWKFSRGSSRTVGFQYWRHRLLQLQAAESSTCV